MGFDLSKWYLDHVTAEGHATVGYGAELRWSGIPIRYASVIECDGTTGRVAERSTFRESAFPRVSDRTLHWSVPRLRVSGRWDALSDSLPPRRLLARNGRLIDWHCHQPRAEVHLNGRKGLGYAEHLHMTEPPWRLDLTELHWGRYVSRKHSLVWIEWRGEPELQEVWYDGAPTASAAVGVDHVEGPGFELRTHDTITLRDGPIAQVLEQAPVLRRVVPAWVSRARERKWLSRGVLTLDGGGRDEGWVIHEVVAWG